MIGKTVGKYRIVERLGRGGMGVVYKAIDETLDRVVAIKTLNPGLLEDEAIKRFRAEAVTVARLNHPRIAAVYELTREDDALLMVMEFVTGETFERLATRAGRLQIDHATSLCCAVLEALQYAHAAGVVHRDLKPANLMLTSFGDVKVMDFGIARVVGSEHLTSDGFMMGTPAYMAPEQVRGLEIDHRTDLYAMAVVLYRLLTGHLPFKADTPIAMIQSQVSDMPTPPRELRAELPEWLDVTLARALAKAPADRFQSANEFRLALEEGLGVATSTRFDTRAYGLDALLETAPVLTPAAMRLPAPTPQPPPTQPMALPAPPPTQPMAQTVPTPTPTAVRVARGGTTVTLRTPHLAAAAVLISLLLVGVGVLGYVVLRRTPAADGVTSSVPPSVPASTDAATPTPPAPDADAPAPPPEPPAVEAPAPPPPIVAAPPRPATVPRPPSSAGAQGTRPTPPAQPPAPTPQAADTVPSEASETPPTVVPDAKPAAVEHPLLKFSEVRVLVADGSKTREQDVALNLESGGIAVRNGKGDQVLKALPYSEVLSATYSESKRPHWKAAPGVAGVPSAFGGSGGLFQRSRNWLTLQSKDDFLILRLERDNLAAVLAAIESRTGVRVQKVSE